jgi:5-formyltetrahydrofolate cyclo-ligase
MDPAAKSVLRSEFRQRRRAAMPAAGQPLAAAARDTLALIPPGRWLGLYWPLGHEPNLLGLAEPPPGCGGCRLALPVVEQQTLLYRAWDPQATLAPDACGIPSPQGPSQLRAGDLGLLMVPALAFDQQGIRLGSGGGWYDRLRADPAWRAVPALAVLPAACLTAQLPRDPWDVPFDGWLDEQGIHWL